MLVIASLVFVGCGGAPANDGPANEDRAQGPPATRTEGLRGIGFDVVLTP